MSHETLHESHDYKGLRIEIHYDYDSSLDRALGDEPCAVLSYEGYGRWDVCHENLDNYPKGNVLAMMSGARRNPELTSESLADELGYDLKTTGKRFAVDYGDGQGWHYYKTDAARLAGMLKHEGWENIKVETFTGPCQGDYYYFVWDQKILDKYAGVKDAKPAIESADDCVNGNVYGFIIKEADGEDLKSPAHLWLDSCWGFVGDPGYCLKEAKSIADGIAMERQEARDSAMAEKIAEERPDLAPQWESRA